jgi:ribonucleoside-triphosphate reductase
MKEALVNYMVKNIGLKKVINLQLKLLEFMRERIANYQIETNNLYNLEATPGEGTSYRLARIDKAKFFRYNSSPMKMQFKMKKPNHITPNSSHMPVDYSDDIFDALDMQDELQTKYTGGTVLHGFIGEHNFQTPEFAKNLG